MEQPLRSTDATVEPTRRKRRKRRRRCKRHPKDGPHSPSCRGQKNAARTTNSTHNLVRTLPTMKPILDYLHVSGEIFTREEIMGHLIEYIKQKCLFDPEDPRKVYCENDELGVIFGCKEFSTANACELLLCNLKELNNPPIAKKESHSFESSACGVLPPWNSSSHGSKYQLVSTTDTCSCSESDQQSTNEASSRNPVPSTSKIILKDRAGSKRRHNDACSDTNQPVHQQSEPFYGIGYTISGYNSSLPSNDGERPLGEYGKHYKHVCADITDVVSDTSDDLFFLNETDEVLTEITDDDTFLEEYEPISYSEEERVIAANQQNQDDNLFNGAEDDTEDAGEDGGDELDNSDADSEIEEDDKWQCESCTERNHPMTRHCRRCWAMRKNWCLPTLNRSISDPVSLQNDARQTDQASVSDCATTSHNIEQEGDDYLGNKCYICQTKPRNGCIVHGQTGHQVCCVGCAKRLKEQRKPCPVCHKKIHRVIQNFL